MKNAHPFSVFFYRKCKNKLDGWQLTGRIATKAARHDEKKDLGHVNGAAKSIQFSSVEFVRCDCGNGIIINTTRSQWHYAMAATMSDFCVCLSYRLLCIGRRKWHLGRSDAWLCETVLADRQIIT